MQDPKQTLFRTAVADMCCERPLSRTPSKPCAGLLLQTCVVRAAHSGPVQGLPCFQINEICQAVFKTAIADMCCKGSSKWSCARAAM